MRHCAVEPRYNEGPGDWQNMIATTKFCYIKVFFPMFNYNQGKDYRSIYLGIR